MRSETRLHARGRPGVARSAEAAPAERYQEVGIRAFAGQVDRVVLSSEPYHFRERHFAEVTAALPGASYR